MLLTLSTLPVFFLDFILGVEDAGTDASLLSPFVKLLESRGVSSLIGLKADRALGMLQFTVRTGVRMPFMLGEVFTIGPDNDDDEFARTAIYPRPSTSSDFRSS